MKKYRDGGIYTADMGEPPQDIDGGSAPKKPAPKVPKPKRLPLTPKQSEAARDEARKRLFEMPRGTTRKLTKDDMVLTSKDKASFRKGGSINGIAKRGLTKCKMV
jgi:hypothetical protein